MKIAHNYLRFMCLRIVSELLPLEIFIRAILRKYHTSDLSGFAFFNDKYSFCELLYFAWVSLLCSSRRVERNRGGCSSNFGDCSGFEGA